jgi:hypothetical protein
MRQLPTLNQHGLLDPGIYSMTLDQIGELFGRFQRTDCRIELQRRLTSLVEEVRSFSFARYLIVDGSFTTAKDDPSDIDLVFVVAEGSIPITTTINPYEYNALSSRRLRKKYAFDVFVVTESSEAYHHYLEHFTHLKEGPADVRKGLVRLELR